MSYQQDEQDTGIPTRAIHEGYISIQQRHQEYRRARDMGGDTHAARGGLQDAVLSFYELLRPHLKHEQALSDYWHGDLPDYTGWNFRTERDAREYIREKGTGVYQIQSHTQQMKVEQRTLTDGGQPESRADWHELLDLSWDSERILSAKKAADLPDLDSDSDSVPYYNIKVFRCAILPLRRLDHWRTYTVTERQSGDGFMGGETHTETRREFQPAQKLVAAKRLLVEAADRLGALSEFDASTQHTEITQEDLEKVEEWRQEQLN